MKKKGSYVEIMNSLEVAKDFIRVNRIDDFKIIVLWHEDEDSTYRRLLREIDGQATAEDPLAKDKREREAELANAFKSARDLLTDMQKFHEKKKQ